MQVVKSVRDSNGVISQMHGGNAFIQQENTAHPSGPPNGSPPLYTYVPVNVASVTTYHGHSIPIWNATSNNLVTEFPDARWRETYSSSTGACSTRQQQSNGVPMPMRRHNPWPQPLVTHGRGSSSSINPPEQEFANHPMSVPTQLMPQSGFQATSFMTQGHNSGPYHNPVIVPTNARHGLAPVIATTDKADQSFSRSNDGLANACAPQVFPRWSGSKQNRTRVIEIEGIIVDEEECRQGQIKGINKIDLYHCDWDLQGSPCGMWIGGDKRDIREHLQKWHNVRRGQDKVPIHCLWLGCTTKPLLKESLSRHVRSVHLGLKWKCVWCNAQYTREDAGRKHEHAEGVEGKVHQAVQVTVLPGEGARVINMHAILEALEGS
ncbi:hypothetical protein BS17DRAFT_191253 [Gyrodon lividus]|nr:hypothetical protein BS17DRAFT_191253 [Gyrodon lividus]